MAEISHDAQKLVDQWMQAHEHKLRAQLALERAQAEEQQAANVLAAVMCPKDMGPDEVVTTWARINRKQERLLSIKKTSAKDYEVQWREPKCAKKTQDG
jgi:hypothetical protein